MTETNNDLQELLERHAAGESVDVPNSLVADFQQAVAADAALRDLLDRTVIAQPLTVDERTPPQLPGDYTIERELGHGGMGVVYLARQKSLQREIAIKVLRPSHQKFRNLVDRFLYEAQHLGKLRHPHIVAIHEIGDADGEPYFTMDYIAGESLTERLRRGPLSPTQAVELFKQVATGVQHAHKHGVVHRDLKPANILLNHQGEAFVTDFGLARQMQQDSSLTQTGEVLGTPQYMAPEQARGETSLVGEATDIHALGLILFEMLSGRPAFEASSPADVLVKVLHQEPESLRRLDNRIPRDLDTICLKCLQKNPTARYASVGALLEDIRRYEAGEPLQAQRPSWLSLAARWCRRHWKPAAAAVMAATLAILLVGPMFDRSYEELVAWGDEELATGDTETAAQVYARAWNKGTESEQRELIGRIRQVCRTSDDPALAVELALNVITLDPTLSFGELDVLIAQTLITRERAASPSGSIDIFHERPRESLELVRQRLELALQRDVPDARRLELEETLSAVKLVLDAGRPNIRYAPDFLHKLPTGTLEELQALAGDDSQPSWNRGKAAIATGQLLEQNGDISGATRSYRQAVELLRPVYPYYSGVRSQLGKGMLNTGAADAEECQLIAGLLADLRRVSPGDAVSASGGVTITLDGVPLPSDVVLALRLELCDPQIASLDAGLPYQLPRLALAANGGESTIGILPGNYRLKVSGHQARWGTESARFMRLLQIDTNHWTSEVTITNEFLKLPPARLWLAEELTLTTPANGAAINLDEAEFSWREVAGASYYQVRFEYTTESPHPKSTMFAVIRTTEPSLRPDNLAAADRQALTENLLTGRTGGWSVEAFDADDRRIGLSLDTHRFVVTKELSHEQVP
ncbi:MAG: serine/threonine-protein kinase [Fuerstiella sp.]